MEEERQEEVIQQDNPEPEFRKLIRETIREYLSGEKEKVEPAYKRELVGERKRREVLEHRVNELVTENERSRRKAEEAERNSAIRDELRRLGVTKVELGFRAVKEDVYRAPDGSLRARSEGGDLPLKEYLTKFAHENPELLPARIPGGSGASARAGLPESSISLESIKPGMDPALLEQARREIANAISHSLHRK